MIPAPTFSTWQSRGTYHQIRQHQLFVIDEGKQHKETVVVLHGYPSCSYDYYAVLPIWTQKYRVIIHDHLGFGLSDKPTDYSYSLIEQADMAVALWQALGLEEVHLLAHDYGTSVATELVARYNLGYEPIRLQTITLGNGSMHIEMAQLIWTQRVLRHPYWGPKLARLSSKALFVNNFRKLWSDKSKIDLEEFDVLWQMLIHNGGRKSLPKVSQYTLERHRFWHRWIGGLRQTDKHIHLVWAKDDPVAIFAMAEALHDKIPKNTLTVLEGVGHYPMLEAAEEYAAAVAKSWDLNAEISSA